MSGVEDEDKDEMVVWSLEVVIFLIFLWDKRGLNRAKPNIIQTIRR
jgi:hypothetical protein